MKRKFEVNVVVEVEDPSDGDPEMEFALSAQAINEAAKVLRTQAEEFDDPNVSIHVYEVP